MSGLRVVDGTASRVDDAALIWAAATAARDGDAEVASLDLARPVIERVLARSPRSMLLVAVDAADRAVGFVAAEPAESAESAGERCAELGYVGVHPDAWGSGVGGSLLAAVPARLAAAGYASAQLLVYIDNAAAVRLYERHGWRRHGSPAAHPRSERLEQRYVLDPLVPSEVVTRRMRETDLAAAVGLVAELAVFERATDFELTEERLAEAMFGDSPVLFGHVAELDGEVAGVALWYLTYATFSARRGIYLEDLYVRSSLRGRGVGRLLLGALAEECVTRGYVRLAWSVLDWNENAIAFYTSLGARPTEQWQVFQLTGDALESTAGDR